MTTLRLNQRQFGLRAGVLGATDNRMGIWTQGCSLPKCPGCTSKHTWSPAAGETVSVSNLLQLAREQVPAPSGLTISGGEPTDQAVAIAELIRGFRAAFPDTEVVLYSGLRWQKLIRRHADLVHLLDVAITGPYVLTLSATSLTGSRNQEVHLLTPSAKRLYQGWDNWPKHRLQIARGSNHEVMIVGIPDTQRIAKAMQQAGATKATWQWPKTEED